MARRTFSEEMRAEARALFDDGFGCNAIAAKLDISPSAISRWAKDEELRFDRSQTAIAVRAHTIDLAAARIELAQKMTVAASDMLDALDEPYLVYNFGGKENDYSEHTLERPPVEVIRSTVVTAGIAFDKLTRIVEKDNGGLDQAVGVLDQLAEGFRTAAEKYRAELVTDAE